MGALDSIVNAPRQQKVIFGVMLLVIVGALSYFLLISPAATDRDGLQQQNEVLRAEVLKATGKFKDVDIVDAKQDLTKTPRLITFEVVTRFEP